VIPGSEPFSLSGGRDGVLLVHGFTGTPHELRFLGEQLHRGGLTVLAPRLAGHGSTPEELDRSSWPQWLACCERGLEELAAGCDRVFVAGFSLGGALALRLALTDARRGTRRITALAVMSTPLWLPFYLRWPLRLLQRTGWDRHVRAVRRLTRGDLRDREQRRTNVVTPAYPLRATLSVLDLLESVRPFVEQVACPTLVLHALHDHTVPYACSSELVRRLRRARRVTLQRSFHVIPLGAERELVARELGAFFMESRHASEVRAVD
jgi:carboxylesterase